MRKPCGANDAHAAGENRQISISIRKQSAWGTFDNVFSTKAFWYAARPSVVICSSARCL